MSIESYFYNGANREKRAGYITGKDPSISAGAAQAYALLDYDPLNQFRDIGNVAFDSVSTKTPEFNNVRARFEKLAKTDPKAAEQLILLYNELGPEKYGDVLGSFADNVAGDKDFAEKMINGLEQNLDSLRQTFKSYAEAKDNRTLDAYINNVKGVRVAAAPPPAPAAPSSSPSPASPVPSSGSSGAIPDTSGMTDEQIESMLGDPKYKDIVDKLKAAGQYDRLVSGVKSNKKILDQLADPGTRKQIASLVQSGDMEGVFRKLGGIQLQTGSGPVNMDDIMAQAKEGLGAMAGMFGGMLESFGLGGVDDRKSGLFSRLLNGIGNDPVKIAINARTEMGQKIGDLLNSTDPEKRKYGEYVAKNMMAEHATGHDKNTQYLLVGAGFNYNQIQKIEHESKTGLVVDISQLKVGIDKDGKKFMQDPIVYKEAPVVQAADRVARGAERAAGVQRDEFGFI